MVRCQAWVSDQGFREEAKAAKVNLMEGYVVRVIDDGRLCCCYVDLAGRRGPLWFSGTSLVVVDLAGCHGPLWSSGASVANTVGLD